jgi:DNA-directed RNA polymerase subunit beta
MEGENGPETPAAPAEDTPAEGEEGEEQEPVANGGEDDIMSAMSLDAVAEAEQADDDE